MTTKITVELPTGQVLCLSIEDAKFLQRELDLLFPKPSITNIPPNYMPPVIGPSLWPYPPKAPDIWCGDKPVWTVAQGEKPSGEAH